MRLNVNGHPLPIRLPETVQVHAHGLTLVSFADLRVVSTDHTNALPYKLNSRHIQPKHFPQPTTCLPPQLGYAKFGGLNSEDALCRAAALV